MDFKVQLYCCVQFDAKMLGYLHLLLLMLIVNLNDFQLEVDFSISTLSIVLLQIKLVHYYLARLQNNFFVSVREELFLEGFVNRSWMQTISGRLIIWIIHSACYFYISMQEKKYLPKREKTQVSIGKGAEIRSLFCPGHMLMVKVQLQLAFVIYISLSCLQPQELDLMKNPPSRTKIVIWSYWDERSSGAVEENPAAPPRKLKGHNILQAHSRAHPIPLDSQIHSPC